ncbi:hypothetical protein ASD11_03765 [Aeromicrobium sp. Root495]|uniref:hypothetical protein n=1 Tax=Aeromicrobium sp. Root495 TaxID=1736550 RepID=UPI0006F9379F|nr:hypothetical protein [Aeromicrobium sp. Root495]KQY58763.1 hypothetical protein ASD11_03765 [Aeromicrobium sp. Root495]
MSTRSNGHPLGLAGSLLAGLERIMGAAERWLVTDQHGLHGAAVARALSGGAVLGILITNFRQRNLLFGPASVWNKPMQDVALYWPPQLTAPLGSTAFLCFYCLVILLAVGWTLGWRAKITGPLMLVGNVAIIERIPVLGDQGDNILRVGLMLLMLMNVTEVWSLDARRRARLTAIPLTDLESTGDRLRARATNLWRSQPVVPRWLANSVHNLGYLMLGFQLVLIYFSAGMFKTQGPLWQHGTGIYYPLQLQEYRPFPALTDLLVYSGIVVNIATYLTVFAQLIFPVALFLHLVTRRHGLAAPKIFFRAVYLVIIGFHLSIAVVMALPWFALEMIAFDAIFVSTATYLALARWLSARGEGLSYLWFDLTDPLVDRLRGRGRSVQDSSA